MKTKTRCHPDRHIDRPIRGGRRVKCATCGDVYPCRHDCDHADCIIATGRELPSWITVPQWNLGDDV